MELRVGNRLQGSIWLLRDGLTADDRASGRRGMATTTELLPGLQAISQGALMARRKHNSVVGYATVRGIAFVTSSSYYMTTRQAPFCGFAAYPQKATLLDDNTSLRLVRRCR